MTIRNKDAYMNALWDWGFLDMCFGNSRIRVSDVDGIVERNGRCLVIEAKGPGVSLNRGQIRLHAELVKKGFTVLILWGEPNKPQAMQIWYPHKPSPCAKQPATTEDIQDLVRRWFNWANANGSAVA